MISMSPQTPRQRKAPAGLRIDMNGLSNDMYTASPASNPTSPGYNSLPSPTLSGSWNTNKTHAELTAMLKEAYNVIKEKERDLTLAAEIGKSLLENNIALKAKYEAVAVQLQHVQRTRSKNSFAQNTERGVPRMAPPSGSLGGNSLEPFPEESSDFDQESDNESDTSGIDMPSSNHRSMRGGLSQRDLDNIHEMEMKNEELSAELDRVINESQENEKHYKAKIRRLEAECATTQEQYAAATEKIETLEQDNQRLMKKQSEDFWNLRYNRTNNENDDDDIIERLQKKVAQLDQSNHTLERSKAEIEKKLQKTVKEMETIRIQYNEVSQTSKDYKALEEKYEQQSVHIAELSMSLEEERDLNVRMRSGGPRSTVHSRAGSFSEHALRRLSDPDAMMGIRGMTSAVSNKSPRRTLLDELENEFYRDFAIMQKKGKNGTPPFSPVMSESDLSEYARSVGMSEAEEDILSAVDYMSDDEFTFLDEFKEDDEKAMRRREWFFRRWARAIIRFLRSIWRWCRFLVLLCAAVLMALYRGPDDVLPGEM